MSEEAQVAEGSVANGMPRRQALCGMVALGVLGPALAACSSNDTVGQPSSGTTASTGGSTPTGSSQGTAVAKLSDLPQGGGKIVGTPDGSPIVLVRGNDGTVKAFSAKCTHQGVTVGAPVNGVMTCPQHNSKFSAADGSVTNGPAQSPLAPVTVTVQGDNVVLG